MATATFTLLVLFIIYYFCFWFRQYPVTNIISTSCFDQAM